MTPAILTAHEARAWLRAVAPKHRLPRAGAVLYVPVHAVPPTPQLVWAVTKFYSGYSIELQKAQTGGKQ